MADFDELRQQLKNTRNSRDEAAQAISAAKEQLKQVADRQAELDRVFDPDNQTHVSQRDRLTAAQTTATETIQLQQELRASAVANELGLVADFEQFSDPRSGIERFNDSNSHDAGTARDALQDGRQCK
jgi:chromosome segregation ATPase